MSPYRPDQQVEEDDDLMDESQGKGIRVLGVAYAPSRYAPHNIYSSSDILVATMFGMNNRVLTLRCGRNAVRSYKTKHSLLHKKTHLSDIVQVLTCTCCSNRDTPVFCALINGEGEVVDFLRLPYFMKRRNAFKEDDREKKVHEGNTNVLLCSQRMLLFRDGFLR